MRTHEQWHSPVQWHLTHGDDNVKFVARYLVVFELIEYQLQSLHGRFRCDGGRRLAVGKVKSENCENDKSPSNPIIVCIQSYCGMVKFVDFLKCRCSVECSGGSILLAGLICKRNKIICIFHFISKRPIIETVLCALFAGAFLRACCARLEAKISCFNRQPKISFLHFAYDCRKSSPARVERRSEGRQKINLRRNPKIDTFRTL